MKCPDCQAAIPEYSKFCYACGAAVAPDLEPEPPAPEDDFSATTRMPMILPPLDETVPFKPTGEALSSHPAAASPRALDETTPLDLAPLSAQEAPPTVENPRPPQPAGPADSGTTSHWGGSPVPAESGAWAAKEPSSSGWGIDASRRSSKSDWSLPREGSPAKSEWAAPAADRASDSGWNIPAPATSAKSEWAAPAADRAADSGWNIPAPAASAKSEWAAPASNRSGGSDWNLPQAGGSALPGDGVPGPGGGATAGPGDSWTIRSGSRSRTTSDDSLMDLELRLHRRRRVVHTILFILILAFLAGAAYFVIQGVMSMRGTKPAPARASSRIPIPPARVSFGMSPRVGLPGPPESRT